MLQATTSPYLSALQAAVTYQYRPAKSSDLDDFCFTCGNRTATGQAYCSDECRQQDEMQSPAPSAVPALVPSSRTGHKSDGSSPPSSATSSPSKIGEGEDEEEDIEKLILPPPVGSYTKRNNFSYGYAYGLATSPVVAKSLTKSPIVRSTPIQRSKSGQSAGIASPPLAASTETITFRRRPQHDSMNGSKANNAMSPALLARRRPSANQSRPSTATSSSSSPATTSAAASTSSQTSASASPATSSLSSILRTSGTFTIPTKAPAHIHAQPTCSRMGCPVSSTLPITSFAQLQRRVSEPHSPYASPKISEGGDPFESSFAIHREASVRRISDTTGRRRPSLSTVTTAPPTLSLGTQQSQPSDYAGFAGFLFARHNQGAQKVDTPDASEYSESGYEAHDEQDRGRRRPSPKKTNSKDGLFMRDLRGNSTGTGSKAPKSSAMLKDKLARVMMSSSSSSDSTTAAPARPTRFIFGRGPASKPAVQQQNAEGSEAQQPLSSEEEVQEEAKTSAVIAAPSRPKHNHSTSVGEGSQYIVTIRPSQKTQRDSSIRPPMGSRKGTRESAIATSSSEEDNAAEGLHMQDTAQERGRTQTRRPSSAARMPVVSPFTALQRAAQGTESRKPDDDSPGPERGRSSQRRSSAAFRSQSPARSHSRASSRSQRRVVA